MIHLAKSFSKVYSTNIVKKEFQTILLQSSSTTTGVSFIVQGEIFWDTGISNQQQKSFNILFLAVHLRDKSQQKPSTP